MTVVSHRQGTRCTSQGIGEGKSMRDANWNPRVAHALGAFCLFTLSFLSVACGGSTAAAPTVASVATKAAPTVAAGGAAVAPTVASAATVVAPVAGTAAVKASGTTAGQLSDAGAGVYTAQCARCHGDKGQGVTGPAVIGASAKFGRFKTAQEYLSYINTNMPIDHPGTLTPDQTLQVTAYLLVQNNLVQKDASLSGANLGSVQLK